MIQSGTFRDSQESPIHQKKEIQKRNCKLYVSMCCSTTSRPFNKTNQFRFPSLSDITKWAFLPLKTSGWCQSIIGLENWFVRILWSKYKTKSPKIHQRIIVRQNDRENNQTDDAKGIRQSTAWPVIMLF